MGMSPIKALTVFITGFGLLVLVGMSVSQTGFADAPAHDGYGVADGAASSTYDGADKPVETGSIKR